MGIVYVSREALHELYYVSMEEGVSLDEYISRVASLTSIPNLQFLRTTHETDILALTIMKQFGITSIFDAYHAATCLSMVPTGPLSPRSVRQSSRIKEGRPKKHLSRKTESRPQRFSFKKRWVPPAVGWKAPPGGVAHSNQVDLSELRGG